jgi:hypothetical protein
MGKWKKVIFVFILEVLCGKEGPRPELFWKVPKKRCCHPHLLKKPKVSPLATSEASALVEKLQKVTDDVVMRDVPPLAADRPSCRPDLTPEEVKVYISLHVTARCDAHT